MLSRNTYLIPQVPSPHHPRTVVDVDGVEVLLQQPQLYLQHHHQHQQQQQEVFPGFYLGSTLENATFFNQENGGLNGEAYLSPGIHRKPTAKKDRHSKINTAQGPRDRRVRLSIGIARKFFDLQEMLGFDKPSKTLDWLLTKSKAAIKELVQTKQNGSGSDNSGKSISSPSENELLSSENGADSKRKSCGKDKQTATAMSPAKESRVKARARARERTLEKMCIKQLGVAGDNASDLNPSFQCRNNQLEFLQLSASSSSNNMSVYPHCLFSNEAANNDLIQESVVIKRKSKNPVFGLQQNLVFSRNSYSNSMAPSANANENWDVFGSNLHAILDQHKFMNSSNSNI